MTYNAFGGTLSLNQSINQSGAPWWKGKIDYSQSLKMTDELKVALQTVWGRVATRTYQQGGGELHQVFDCLHGYGCQWWSLWASVVTLSISKSASSSYYHQTGSFQSQRGPRVGLGQPSSPLFHLLPHLFPFSLFPFFHWLYLFSSFVRPFPFYQNSPTPFPGRRS